MPSRDTKESDLSPARCPIAFDEKLGKDVLSTISRLFADGKQFLGHDGRQYVIIGFNKEESGSETFIDVVVRSGEGHELVAKYAIVLQQISRSKRRLRFDPKREKRAAII